MQIEQIYTGCLAQGAYYIESEGEAVIIDPLREIAPYTEMAARDNARIKYVLETHFHADFVSGHLDLARHTGATIVYGPGAKPGFAAHVADDGEMLKVGMISFEVIHTPGHTMESTCYLMYDETGKAVALFSGDTLFIGDVGRPDLAVKLIPELTSEKLAGLLYDSLREKIIPLPDEIIIYPAHGAGSACGKVMSKETSDTLGHQKRVNYALQPMSKPEFIRQVTSGLTTPPGYFPANVLMNIRGYESIDTVLERGVKPLNSQEFAALAAETGAVILDTRNAQTFAKGFIPGAINIGIDGSFAPWVGTLIPDLQQPILLVTEKGREAEAVTRLARVGYDQAVGYLEGGFEAWQQSIDTVKSVTADELAERLMVETRAAILDVRKRSEYVTKHMTGAKNIPLDYIYAHMEEVDRSRSCYVYCGSGYRSMVFISLLQAKGYHRLIDVKGGFNAVSASGHFLLS
jgi:hydroxyacylglutathione hydrolase